MHSPVLLSSQHRGAYIHVNYFHIMQALVEGEESRYFREPLSCELGQIIVYTIKQNPMLRFT